MGLAAGPAETVAPDVVGEVFFIHERGRAMVRVSWDFSNTADGLVGCIHVIPRARADCRRNIWGIYCRRVRLALDKLDQRDHGGLSLVALLPPTTRDSLSSAGFRVCDWRGDAKEGRSSRVGRGTNAVSSFYVQ
jgi:hypothetical protein